MVCMGFPLQVLCGGCPMGMGNPDFELLLNLKKIIQLSNTEAIRIAWYYRFTQLCCQWTVPLNEIGAWWLMVARQSVVLRSQARVSSSSPRQG
jgi:hypothetical protein